MTYSQILTGSFPIPPGLAGLPAQEKIGVDGRVASVAGYSPGLTLTTRVGINPTLVQRWLVTGWTVRLRLGFGFSPPAAFPNVMKPFWGRVGPVWAGLLLGVSEAMIPYAQFPADLSTFTKVWDTGDPLRQVPRAMENNPVIPIEPETSYGLVATTFMLPQRLEVRSGAQLSLSLVVTPTLMDSQIYGFYLALKSCSYSVLFVDADA